MDIILRFSALRLPRLDAWIMVTVVSDPSDRSMGTKEEDFTGI